MPFTTLSSMSVIKSAAYTAGINDGLALLSATSASFAVTLPSAATVPSGLIFRFRRTDAVSTNTITITPFGSETINGSSNFVLIAQEQELDITSDGSNWQFASQIKINASVYVAGPASFTTTSSSYTNVTGSQFATKTLAGGAQNPATANDLALKIAYLPKGTYQIMAYISWANGTSGFSANGRIFDGTNQIGQTSFGQGAVAATSTIGGVWTYATDQTNITFVVQGRAASGGGQFVTGTFNGSQASDVQIVVTRLN